ncbi:helix-turn-helix domain-containing protein [Streptomyces sp. NPDC001380]|uniref:helix-turn-helix domain-containing protein n=1 Tax=Streptomyces sp. NPDC001380 TaxID=3364566 RepID=UPI00367D8443
MTGPDQLRAELARIGRQHARVRQQDRKVSARAKAAAAEAFEVGMSAEEIAALTGYQASAVARWRTRVERAERRGALATLLEKWLRLGR